MSRIVWIYADKAFLPSSYSEMIAGFKLLTQNKTTKQLKYLLLHTVAHTDRG